MRLLLALLTTAVFVGGAALVAPGVANGETVGATPCDEDAHVDVSYVVATADPRWVDAVVVSDLSEDCRHSNVKVSLYDDEGGSLVDLQKQHLETSPTLLLQFETPVPAASVYRVDVVIGGARR